MVETPPAFEPSVAVCLDIKYERLVKANTSKGQERNATLDPTKNKQEASFMIDCLLKLIFKVLTSKKCKLAFDACHWKSLYS